MKNIIIVSVFFFFNINSHSQSVIWEFSEEQEENVNLFLRGKMIGDTYYNLYANYQQNELGLIRYSADGKFEVQSVLTEDVNLEYFDPQIKYTNEKIYVMFGEGSSNGMDIYLRSFDLNFQFEWSKKITSSQSHCNYAFELVDQSIYVLYDSLDAGGEFRLNNFVELSIHDGTVLFENDQVSELDDYEFIYYPGFDLVYLTGILSIDTTHYIKSIQIDRSSKELIMKSNLVQYADEIGGFNVFKGDLSFALGYYYLKDGYNYKVTKYHPSNGIQNGGFDLTYEDFEGFNWRRIVGKNGSNFYVLGYDFGKEEQVLLFNNALKSRTIVLEEGSNTLGMDLYYGSQLVAEDSEVTFFGTTYDSDFTNVHGRMIKYSISGLESSVVNSMMPQINFQLYPNPAETMLNLKVDERKKYQFRIYNLAGSLVIDGVLGKNMSTIDLSKMREGMYNLVLMDEEGNTASRSFTVIR